MTRALPPHLARALREASGASFEVQRRIARATDPKAFAAWKGWTWGRKRFELEAGAIDHAPAEVRRFCALHAIEYLEAKGKGSRPVPYRHEFDAPFATVATTSTGAPHGARISSRGAPRLGGESVFVLGHLEALEGPDDTGAVVRWEPPCAGWVLVGCPRAGDMHVIRRGAALRHPPVWILRGRSRYALTDRGIVR